MLVNTRCGITEVVAYIERKGRFYFLLFCLTLRQFHLCVIEPSQRFLYMECRKVAEPIRWHTFRSNTLGKSSRLMPVSCNEIHTGIIVEQCSLWLVGYIVYNFAVIHFIFICTLHTLFVRKIITRSRIEARHKVCKEISYLSILGDR